MWTKLLLLIYPIWYVCRKSNSKSVKSKRRFHLNTLGDRLYVLYRSFHILSTTNGVRRNEIHSGTYIFHLLFRKLLPFYLILFLTDFVKLNIPMLYQPVSMISQYLQYVIFFYNCQRLLIQLLSPIRLKPDRN